MHQTYAGQTHWLYFRLSHLAKTIIVSVILLRKKWWISLFPSRKFITSNRTAVILLSKLCRRNKSYIICLDKSNTERSNAEPLNTLPLYSNIPKQSFCWITSKRKTCPKYVTNVLQTMVTNEWKSSQFMLSARKEQHIF